jgi:Fe-S cluster biogenesis protein NfuA
MTTASGPSTTEFTVELEFTPNPNTLKYVTNSAFLLSGAVNFKTPAEAVGKSLLAEKLFSLKGIDSLMVGKNFVTVTLSDQDSLTELNDSIIESIRAFLQSGQQAVRLDAIPSDEDRFKDLGDIEKRIVSILDAEIRPAVAMDGGDITFEKFQDGIVFLHMKGSCSGCPSSTATLKMGIENRLKGAIPEVLEVVAV